MSFLDTFRVWSIQKGLWTTNTHWISSKYSRLSSLFPVPLIQHMDSRIMIPTKASPLQWKETQAGSWYQAAPFWMLNPSRASTIIKGSTFCQCCQTPSFLRFIFSRCHSDRAGDNTCFLNCCFNSYWKLSRHLQSTHNYFYWFFGFWSKASKFDQFKPPDGRYVQRLVPH